MSSLLTIYGINATGVYAINHIDSGKKYIGSTGVSFKDRWYEHVRLLRKSTHPSKRLQNAWNKYGEIRFEFSIICTCEPEHVLKMEQYFIDEFKSHIECFGYNISHVAGSVKGCKKSKETIEKMRLAATGFCHSKETREKMSLSRKGKPHSPSHSAAIARSLIGIKKSPEARMKMSISKMGRKLSPEHKERLISASRTPEAAQKRLESYRNTVSKRKNILGLN